jgi:hypothetical protein
MVFVNAVLALALLALSTGWSWAEELTALPTNRTAVAGTQRAACDYTYWNGRRWKVPSKYTMKINYISSFDTCADLCCQDGNCNLFSWDSKKSRCYKHNASTDTARYKYSRRWNMGCIYC